MPRPIDAYRAIDNIDWRRYVRLLSDIAWVVLLVITPWCLFERFFLANCERAVCKRLEALKDADD